MQHLNGNHQKQPSTTESSNVIVIQDGQTIPAKPTNETKTRVATLDVFRGLTIAVMILVDDAGGKWPQINHSPWNGCTLADFVMPFFLFIVGVAVALTFKVVQQLLFSRHSQKPSTSYDILHNSF
uniref:Heparan-alpha-glucosaminide N-acetyltransferase catalytic domain-containing protein n=1 Tax=Picea sitchensis TaxID=3332 RepID=A9NX21_PICSI|nr:unknown [Picea sitchensis]